MPEEDTTQTSSRAANRPAGEPVSRKSFATKLILILMLQLIFTFVFVVNFLFVEKRIFTEKEAAELYQKHEGAFTIVIIVFFADILAIKYLNSVRENKPQNIISLIILTVLASYVIAFACVFFPVKIILSATITVVVIISMILIVAFLTRFRLHSYAEIAIMVILEILSSIWIVMTLMWWFVGIKALRLPVGLTGITTVSIDMFADIHTVMESRDLELSTSKLVLTTACIYFQIVCLFSFYLLCHAYQF